MLLLDAPPRTPEEVEYDEPPPSLRRRMPAVTAADPRGVMVPGRDVGPEEACDWEDPRAMVT